jgi:hypothetical protein
MDLNQLMEVISSLSLKRPLFHSEADFQQALAWEIKNKFKSYEIRLEVRKKGKKDLDKNKDYYIDILLITSSGEQIPIELKYKTSSLAYIDNNKIKEEFLLKEHGAKDIGRYLFIKDIMRIEYLKNQNNISKGYVIFLTNESNYWIKSNRKSVDENFKLFEDKVLPKNKFLVWNSNANWTKDFPKLKLNSDYKINWINYSKVKDKEFKYIILEI